MTKLETLIKQEASRHKNCVVYSYSINDLIAKDLLENKKFIENKTIKELCTEYTVSYWRMALILRQTGIKVKKEYNKRKNKKKVKQIKMTHEEHCISAWASSFNRGRLRYVYYDMLRRCYKKEDRGYYRYGARGITVCDEWRKDCKVFYKWAKDNGYAEGLQLDRKDNNKGYSPGNCRWVTQQENIMNRSNTRYIIYKGEAHTLKEWAEITGLSYQVLADRIYRYGWDIDRALTESVARN